MKNLYILSEGRSEVNFIKSSLANYIGSTKPDICLIPVTIPTSQLGKGGWRRNGDYAYAVQKIQEIMCYNKSGFYTTFFDLYGLPLDLPCLETIKNISDPLLKAEVCEKQFITDVKIGGQYRFFPHVQPHELEAFLYVEPNVTAKFFGNDAQEINFLKQEIQKIKDSYKTPEYINDSKETAPSKRLIQLKPLLKSNKAGGLGLSWKPLCEIGIEAIRKQCLHFNKWLQKIESL